jgi:arylsulfatase A-like enzyme
MEIKHRLPNIIVIMADDLGCCDLGCYGNKNAVTPNLDYLAESGIRLDHHYSASPMCAPARAGFLTGLHPHKVGATDVPCIRGMCRVNPNVVTLPKLLKTKGYHTGLIGKWHNGGGHDMFHPIKYGYDEFCGFEGGVSPYFDYDLERGFEEFEHVTDEYMTDRLTDEAISFMRKCGNEPFHLHLAYNAPHRPLEAPKEDIERFEAMDGVTKGIQILYAMVARMDWNIGRLMRYLEENNLRKDTIILFLSDNGPDFVGEGDMSISDRPCHCFNGHKGDVLEGGVRVPAFISWPGVLPEGEVNSQPSVFLDWLPTFAELIGVDTVQMGDVDGHDIWPILTEHQPNSADYYWHWTRYELVSHSNMAVYHDGYKLYYPVYGDNHKYHKPDNPYAIMKGSYKIFTDHISREHPPEDFKPMLFYLPDDPMESRDLYNQKPEVVEKLRDMLDRWFEDALKEYKKAARVTLVNPEN